MKRQPRREHTDREYEAELAKLRDNLLAMGAAATEMIASSMRALELRDTALAHRIIERDHEVNRIEVETDELCLRILARRQPVASDLRFITIALKLVTDLERIGDLAVNICERVVELNQEPPLSASLELPKMADTVRAMVRRALDAFVAADAAAAQKIMEEDRVVDARYAELFRELFTSMTQGAENIQRATRLQSIAKYLERIGDHATNLAEMVVFMVKGKDIRHMGGLEPGKGRIPHGVLFVCVHNAARSQMAEGWAKKLLPLGVRIWSAGSAPAERVDPAAVLAMREVGIDISEQRPKRISDVSLGDIDTVVSLCQEEVCLGLPSDLRQLVWPLSDPAAAKGSQAEVEAAFRRVRDELRARIERLLDAPRADHAA